MGFIAAVVIGGGGEDDGRTTKRVSNGFDCHLKTQYTLLSQCTIISEWCFGVVGIFVNEEDFMTVCLNHES